VADRPEAVPAQQRGHVVRGEQRQPGLAPLGGRRPDLLRVKVTRLVAQPGRQHVVDDDLAARREAARHRQGLLDGAALQVHRDTQPADERGPGEVEPGLAEPVAQRVAAEIHRDERGAARRRPGAARRRPGAARRRPGTALPFLRRRMVDFEDPDPGGQGGSAGEGVQARAEQDVLADAAPDAVGQAVLGVAAAAGGLRPGARQDRVRAVRPVERDVLVGLLTEHGLGQRVGENDRSGIDDEVGGPRGRGGERGKARLSVSYHAGKITFTFPL